MNALEAKEYGLVDDILGGSEDIVQVRNGEIVVPEIGDAVKEEKNGAK